MVDFIKRWLIAATRRSFPNELPIIDGKVAWLRYCIATNDCCQFCLLSSTGYSNRFVDAEGYFNSIMVEGIINDADIIDLTIPNSPGACLNPEEILERAVQVHVGRQVGQVITEL